MNSLNGLREDLGQGMARGIELSWGRGSRGDAVGFQPLLGGLFHDGGRE